MKYKQSISLGFSYPVVFTCDIFSEKNSVLMRILGNDQARIIFFIDDCVKKQNKGIQDKIKGWITRHKSRFQICSPIQVVQGGEQVKNSPDTIESILKTFHRFRLCRHSYVIIIGGGAVLDAVGFAAAIAHRGLRQIRIPTTVLSQNDSGVGVKNGINRFGIKNFIGTFAPPQAVINDKSFLKTLSYRDWISGLSEAFKIGIIKDNSFLIYLKSSSDKLKKRDLSVMEEVIRRCALLHCEHLSATDDPFEKGSFRPLDFGHWAAHRLESLCRNRLRHGEAVSIGMALDLFSAYQLGLINRTEATMVIKAMLACDLPVWNEMLLKRNSNGELKILKGLQDFKEHLGGKLTLTMPLGLGNMTEINTLPENIIRRSINELQKLAKKT